MRRFTSLSSTISTRTPRSRSNSRPEELTSPGSNGTSNQKVLPRPGSLVTPTSPPIASTMEREIARPSPVPPNLRLVEESACVNAENNFP